MYDEEKWKTVVQMVEVNLNLSLFQGEDGEGDDGY